MTSEEIQKAEAIVREWFWQPDSWHRKSVIRYYESAPIQPDVLQLVIAYLKQQETDRLFILNKEHPLGEAWKATDAWFQTSPSDKWAGTESTKIRIYQAFKPKADESDGPYTVENGCKYLVTHEFHWDVAEVPTLPASSSGINYTLQGATRDKETGLYSCVIEKRETVQQDVELYDTDMTIFETVQEEQHLGVKANDVDATGQQASAANGVLVKRQIRKNPDCTSNVVNEVTIEKPVEDAVVRVEKTYEGIIRTTKNRNQENPKAEPSEMKPGSSITNEKTPGGRYDQTIVEADETPLGVKGRDCEKTIFEHRDVVTENVPDDPGEQHGSAANGTIVQKSAVMTRLGTWDKKQITLVEQPVENAVVQFQKTLRGTLKVKIDRNQTTPLNDGTGTGETPMEVGETRRTEKTPGGLYNNTVEKRTTDPAGKILHGKDVETVRSTAFETNNQANDPGEISLTAEVNKSKRKVARKTESGNWDVEEQETDYTPVLTSKTWTDEKGTHVYCSYRNQTQPLTPPSLTSGNWDQTTASFSENDHGSYDGSYTCFQAAAPSESGKTLQYETESEVSTKFYYLKAGGEMVYREISGTWHLAYGKAKHIMSEVKDAEECALVGWRTRIGSGDGIVSGTWYTGIQIGAETKVDSGNQGV